MAIDLTPVWSKHLSAPIPQNIMLAPYHKRTDEIRTVDARKTTIATPTTITPRISLHSPACALHAQFAACCHPTTTLKYQPILRLVFFCLLPCVHRGWRGFLRTSPKGMAAVFVPVFSLRWPVLSVPAPAKTGEVLKYKI